MIDLDKKRAARIREGKRESVQVRLGGQTFDFPVELPYVALERWRKVKTSDDALGVLKVLLNGQYSAFVKAGLTPGDLTELLLQLRAEYGLDPGKAESSSVS